MAKTGDIIKSLRIENNMTQKQLAAAIKVSESAVGMYEQNRRVPKYETLEVIADFFNVDMNYILGKSEIKQATPLWKYKIIQDLDMLDNLAQQEAMNRVNELLYKKPVIKSKLIPIVGDVACGNPIYAEENIQEYITVQENDNVDFALYARGSSMNNCKIDNGDIVFIKKQPIVNNGEIALVLIDDEATIKRFYDHGDRVILRPDSTNPEYQEKEYSKKDHTILIQGKVVFIKTFIY